MPSSTYVYVLVTGTLALVCGLSIAWNMVLLGQVRSAQETRERLVVTTAAESIRRSGTVAENDPVARTLTVRYSSDSGTGENLMLVSIGKGTQIQRVYAEEENGVIVATRIAKIEQEMLQVDEPVYVVTLASKIGEPLNASNILVGDILPRY